MKLPVQVKFTVGVRLLFSAAAAEMALDANGEEIRVAPGPGRLSASLILYLTVKT
jgi:hypothetical protein